MNFSKGIRNEPIHIPAVNDKIRFFLPEDPQPLALRFEEYIFGATWIDRNKPVSYRYLPLYVHTWIDFLHLQQFQVIDPVPMPLHSKKQEILSCYEYM